MYILSQKLSSINSRTCMWNQDLVNLNFDDNKTRFKTNDYISNMIRQDDF